MRPNEPYFRSWNYGPPFNIPTDTLQAILCDQYHQQLKHTYKQPKIDRQENSGWLCVKGVSGLEQLTADNIITIHTGHKHPHNIAHILFNEHNICLVARETTGERWRTHHYEYNDPNSIPQLNQQIHAALQRYRLAN